MLYYRQNYRQYGEETAVNKNINAQNAELWECALNYSILRRLKENSEEEAWARLLSCSLFSAGVCRAEQSKEKRAIAAT